MGGCCGDHYDRTLPRFAPVGLAVGASGIGAASVQLFGRCFQEVFSQEFGAAFMEYVESGIDPETAFLTAFMVGGINGGIELAQIGTLMAAFREQKGYRGTHGRRG